MSSNVSKEVKWMSSPLLLAMTILSFVLLIIALERVAARKQAQPIPALYARLTESMSLGAKRLLAALGCVIFGVATLVAMLHWGEVATVTGL
jgi:type IV secretory pathway VirB2 component (pilin)